MRLIKTNDGMIGLDLDSKTEVIWPETRSMVYSIGWHSMYHKHRMPMDKWITEVDTTIDIMTSRGDDIAVMGDRGNLLWTTQSNEE